MTVGRTGGESEAWNMAVFNYDEFGVEPESAAFQGALNWAGAILSVALIAGLATWGWKLWVRDVSGVPVVRALEGPMRTLPDEPGGMATEYQGLSVNRIAEERSEESMADRVVLAPQPSVLDEDEDLAMAELAPLPEREPTVLFGSEPGSANPDIGEGLSVEMSDSDVAAIYEGTGNDLEAAESLIVRAPVPGMTNDEVAAVEAPAVQTPTVETPVVETPAIEAEAADGGMSATDIAVAAALGILGDEEPAEEPVETASLGPTIIMNSPRPAVRPERVERVSTPAIDSTTGEIDAATIPSGTRLVQLGAYGSAEMARDEWETAMARFGDYMVGKERIVQEAQSGGRTFWRLRAMGFEGLSDARRFCAVLVADGANCIPVVQD